MKSVIFWLLGVMVAFFATAGAFLLLAEFGSEPSERNLASDAGQGGTGSPLLLNIGEEQLKELESKPDQTLTIGMRNQGESRLSDISLTFRVTSEDTATPEVRFDRITLPQLDPGEYTAVNLSLNLSPLDSSRGSIQPSEGPGRPRSIIEVRATTPEGVSAVRTAILPS